MNNFSQESVGHIGHAAVQQLEGALNTVMSPQLLIESVTTAIFETAKLIYSDEKFPENVTCWLEKEENDIAFVRLNTGWAGIAVQLVLAQMVDKSIGVLLDNQRFESISQLRELLLVRFDVLNNRVRRNIERQMRIILVLNDRLCDNIVHAQIQQNKTSGQANKPRTYLVGGHLHIGYFDKKLSPV